MEKTTVLVHGHKFDFPNYKEAISYVMNLAISHHKYATLDTLKENVCEACDLISELFVILSEQAEEKLSKTNLKKSALRIMRAKGYLTMQKEKDIFLLVWADMMMAIEGNGLLHGFGFGTKRYNDVIKGNSEKISVAKAGR